MPAEAKGLKKGGRSGNLTNAAQEVGWSQNQRDGVRESILKENSSPEIYAYSILMFSADKRSHWFILMHHRVKNPPMKCNSGKFE